MDDFEIKKEENLESKLEVPGKIIESSEEKPKPKKKKKSRKIELDIPKYIQKDLVKKFPKKVLAKIPRPKVYLSGGMEKTKSGGAVWRDHWMEKLNGMGFDCYDLIAEERNLPLPIMMDENETWLDYMKRWNRLKYQNREKYKEGARVIMDNDINYIVNEADLVVMRYTRSAGSGTLGENAISYWFKKPQYAVVDDKSLHLKNVGMWVIGASEEVDWHFNELIPDLKVFLKKYYVKQAFLFTKYKCDNKKIGKAKKRLVKLENDLETKLNEELKLYQ